MMNREHPNLAKETPYEKPKNYETRVDSDKKSFAEQRLLTKSIQSVLYEGLSMGSFDHFDPMLKISHQFRTVFESTGRELIEKMLEGKEQEASATMSGLSCHADPPGLSGTLSTNRALRSERQYQSSLYENKAFYQKFSELSFFNGHFSAAILNGDARLMFITNLFRSLGQSNPLNNKEAYLSASLDNAVHQKGSTFAITNNWIQSATGIVIDANKGASRIIEDLKWLASCDIPRLNKGKETSLNNTLPFLSTEKDIASIEKYTVKMNKLLKTQSQLSKDKTANKGKLDEIQAQIQILKKAVETLNHSIEKKRLMTMDFKNKLSHLISMYTKSQKELQKRPVLLKDLQNFAAGLGDFVPPDGSGSPDKNGNSGKSPASSASLNALFEDSLFQ